MMMSFYLFGLSSFYSRHWRASFFSRPATATTLHAPAFRQQV